MELDTRKEEIEDVVIDDERERHWHMDFEENNGGLDGTKTLLHANKWDVYNSYKEALVKGGYLVEVSHNDGKKVIWEVIDDHVVEEGVKHEDLGLQGLILIYLMNRGRGVLGTM